MFRLIKEKSYALQDLRLFEKLRENEKENKLSASNLTFGTFCH